MDKNKIKISDYIVSFLENIGVGHVFTIPGGGIMHLTDSIGRAKKLKYVCNHHEQACAIAAEAYGRIKGLGVCLVTTAPGGTNTLTGVAGAWLDSIPMLVIAGQVNVQDTIGSTGLPLRQLGYQEINMIDIVRSMTKYAAIVKDPKEIRYEFEKAVYMAKTGRPGPVWLEVPLNVQGSYLENVKNLRRFDPREVSGGFDSELMKRRISEIIARLKRSKRPVLFVGNGIRLADAADDILKLVDMLKIPVLASPLGYDLIHDSHRYYMGRPQAFAAQRAANFVIQNCDMLLGIGARFDYSVVGYNYKTFAREAFKAIVDIDEAELKKPSLRPHIAVHADAKEFILEFMKQLDNSPLTLRIDEWIEYCRRMNRKYPVVLPEFWKEKKYVNSYCFIDKLSDEMQPGNTLVISNGTALTCTHRAFRVKLRQRVILNSGCAAMGYGLSAAIGVCFANGKKPLVCIEGDGSLHLNIHELQTMKHHRLPIKLFVYNNKGYLAMKITQQTYMQGKFVAADPGSGVSFPDFRKIADAYDIPYIKLSTNDEIEKKIQEMLNHKGPIFCEIMMDPLQSLIPKLRADRRPDGSLVQKPLEDLYPFLPREEFRENMLIKPLESSET